MTILNSNKVAASHLQYLLTIQQRAESQNLILFLNNYFNKILSSKKVPIDWGFLSTFMLYKKGDTSNTENYRPITLINCTAEIFIQIICDRLVSWANKLCLIPESQSGFSRGRSCLTNLCCLSSIIQIHLNASCTVVYAAFIYFKGAFPYISYRLL